MRKINRELITALVKEAEGQVVERLQLDKLTQLACKAADETFESQMLMSEDTEHCYYNKDSRRWEVIWWWNAARKRELWNDELFLRQARNNK